MNIRTQLDAYFAAHQDEILADIATLVAIPSVMGTPEPGKPFGAAPHACLLRAKQMAEDYGFTTTLYGDCVVAIDMGPTAPGLDILAHLDVVPPGEGWTVTDPYTMKIVGDRIYGRGTIDDKGPAVVSLWAMKAVRELGIDLRHRIRLILGSNEENGSHDLDVYYAQEQESPMSFSPDGDYPVINIEKCGVHPQFHGNFAENTALPRVKSLHSGTVFNAVPAHATAVVEGLSLGDVEAALSTLDLPQTTLSETAEGITIQVQGTAAHGSTPEKGVNALTALLTLLKALPLAESQGQTALHTLHSAFPFGEFYGETPGVAMADEHGALTLTLNVLHYTPTALDGYFDMRAAVCATTETALTPLLHILTAGGIVVDDCAIDPAHVVAADSPLVQTLLGIYAQYTGKENPQPLCIGGGTYVHRLKNGVAFGCMELDTDYHLHDVDEFAIIPELMRSGKLFAQAIIDL